MPDQIFKCRDCGNPFEFAAEEQEAFARRGFFHPPSRCLSCRETRAASRPQNPSQGNFSNGNVRREEPTMHPAVCATCGKATEVPFLPRGDRPVYCRECHAKQRPRTASGSSRRDW